MGGADEGGRGIKPIDADDVLDMLATAPFLLFQARTGGQSAPRTVRPAPPCPSSPQVLQLTPFFPLLAAAWPRTLGAVLPFCGILRMLRFLRIMRLGLLLPYVRGDPLVTEAKTPAPVTKNKTSLLPLRRWQRSRARARAIEAAAAAGRRGRRTPPRGGSLVCWSPWWGCSSSPPPWSRCLRTCSGTRRSTSSCPGTDGPPPDPRCPGGSRWRAPLPPSGGAA